MAAKVSRAVSPYIGQNACETAAPIAAPRLPARAGIDNMQSITLVNA
jgi:hypothetical protein